MLNKLSKMPIKVCAAWLKINLCQPLKNHFFDAIILKAQYRVHVQWLPMAIL